MPIFKATYQGQSTRIFSGNLWAGCPYDAWQLENDDGFCFSDDFRKVGTWTTNTTQAETYPYTQFTDNGPVIGAQASNDEETGVVTFQMGTGDNEEATLTVGGNTGNMVEINSTSGSDFRTWFECRFKFSQILDTISKEFIGLGPEGAAVNDGVMADAGLDVADNGFIGFMRQEDNGNEIHFIYKAAGQTTQEHITAIHVPVADTYMNLGFAYNPAFPAAKRIKVFLDNVEQSTYVTQTNIDAATFPEAEPLTMVANCKNAGTTDNAFEMDWWALAQASSS